MSSSCALGFMSFRRNFNLFGIYFDVPCKVKIPFHLSYMAAHQSCVPVWLSPLGNADREALERDGYPGFCTVNVLAACALPFLSSEGVWPQSPAFIGFLADIQHLYLSAILSAAVCFSP